MLGLLDGVFTGESEGVKASDEIKVVSLPPPTYAARLAA